MTRHIGHEPPRKRMAWLIVAAVFSGGWFFFGFLIWSALAANAADTSWHLFTQTEGGTISLLHGLSKHECEFAMNRALNKPATDEEREQEKAYEKARSERVNKACAEAKDKNGFIQTLSESISCQDGKVQGYSYSGRQIFPSDIRRAECFQ